MKSIFKRIIDREIPSYIIAEDENHLAFLDINPLKEGHTLVIPKNEIDYIFDMDDKNLSDLILFAKKVSKQIKANIFCTKVGMTVVGLEVPHAHIHLIPINSIEDMNFSRPKIKIDSNRLLDLQVLLSK
jgi:histidine triad (HIT) family protein